MRELRVAGPKGVCQGQARRPAAHDADAPRRAFLAGHGADYALRSFANARRPVPGTRCPMMRGQAQVSASKQLLKRHRPMLRGLHDAVEERVYCGLV